MMKLVREWNNEKTGGGNKICVSLELEKPSRHPIEYAELCDVLFISQVYAEENLQAKDMVEAVTKARGAIQNKK